MSIASSVMAVDKWFFPAPLSPINNILLVMSIKRKVHKSKISVRLIFSRKAKSKSLSVTLEYLVVVVFESMIFQPFSFFIKKGQTSS